MSIFHQRLVYDFTKRVFGVESAHDKRERAMRFLEEAMELAHATETVTKVDVANLINRVFNRPLGDIKQEVGQVQTTLLALCCAYSLSGEQCLENEISRALGLDAAALRERDQQKKAVGL